MILHRRTYKGDTVELEAVQKIVFADDDDGYLIKIPADGDDTVVTLTISNWNESVDIDLSPRDLRALKDMAFQMWEIVT